MVKEFRRTEMGNEVLEGDGEVFVSYRDMRQHSIASPFLDMFNQIGEMLMDIDTSQQETALYVDGVWRILNGDFRKEYAGLIDQGAKACIEFYQ